MTGEEASLVANPEDTKNEQKEEVSRQRPKSVIYNGATFSDSYGQIPNLRDSMEKDNAYFPIKNQLSGY